MSFSSQVKEELSRQFQPGRHCQIAEIAAILSFAGGLEGEGSIKRAGGEGGRRGLEGEGGTRKLVVYTENLPLARKYFVLMKETFQVAARIAVRQNIYLHKNRLFIISFYRLGIHSDLIIWGNLLSVYGCLAVYRYFSFHNQPVRIPPGTDSTFRQIFIQSDLFHADLHSRTFVRNC